MTNEVERELKKILGKLSGLDEMQLEHWSECFKTAREYNKTAEADRFYWSIGAYIDALMWHEIIEIEEATILEDWYRWHETRSLENYLKKQKTA